MRSEDDGMRWDRVWLDARVVTVAHGRPGLGVIDRGVVAARDGRIAFIGAKDELPRGRDAAERIDWTAGWSRRA